MLLETKKKIFGLEFLFVSSSDWRLSHVSATTAKWKPKKNEQKETTQAFFSIFVCTWTKYFHVSMAFFVSAIHWWALQNFVLVQSQLAHKYYPLNKRFHHLVLMWATPRARETKKNVTLRFEMRWSILMTWRKNSKLSSESDDDKWRTQTTDRHTLK